MTHVYVALQRDSDGYPPYDTEEIDAVHIGGDRYRLVAVPVFAYGLAVGDVVRVVRVVGDARLWVAEVLEESGHWTARIVPAKSTESDSVVRSFQEAGCLAHPTPFGLIAVDVPATVSQETVMHSLERGRDEGLWDFDLGVLPS